MEPLIIVLALLCILSISNTAAIPEPNNDRRNHINHHYSTKNINNWRSSKLPQWVTNLIDKPESMHIDMNNGHLPTMEPTPRPSPSPTTLSKQTDIQNICKYMLRNGVQTDFIVLFDTSCHLKRKDCKSLLKGVSSIISKLMLSDSDSSATNRVQTMQMKAHGHTKILVSFDDINLQKNPQKYVSFIKEYRQCDRTNKRSTDIVKALNDAMDWFNMEDGRIHKIIIVNICKDERTDKICSEIAPNLSDKGIETLIINLIDGSKAKNVITMNEANTYLKCVAPNHVCIGDDKRGVSVKEFDNIIGNCLLPQICIVKKAMAYDVDVDVTIYPTPEPTPKPSPSPTLLPPLLPTSFGCEGEFDVVIFIDNSCKLKRKVCDRLLEGIGEIVYSLLDYPLVKVATVQFGGYRHSLKILIDFDDISLQKDAQKYVKYIEQNGECTECGDGDTNLYYALRRAQKLLHHSKKTKYIIISVCKDMHKICKISEEIDAKDIDLYIVNLISAGSNDNVIVDEQDAHNYLLCLVEGEVCVAHKTGVTMQIFDEIIEQCLLPQICET